MPTAIALRPSRKKIETISQRPKVIVHSFQKYYNVMFHSYTHTQILEKDKNHYLITSPHLIIWRRDLFEKSINISPFIRLYVDAPDHKSLQFFFLRFHSNPTLLMMTWCRHQVKPIPSCSDLMNTHSHTWLVKGERLWKGMVRMYVCPCSCTCCCWKHTSASIISLSFNCESMIERLISKTHSPSLNVERRFSEGKNRERFKDKIPERIKSVRESVILTGGWSVVCVLCVVVWDTHTGSCW